jgi:hypothetical protein
MVNGPAVVLGVFAPEIKGGEVHLPAEGVNDPDRRIGADEVLQAEQARLPTVGTLNVSHGKEVSFRKARPTLRCDCG